MEAKDTEEYLLLHFKEKVEHKFLNKPNLYYKIINLESDNPIIQIGTHVFRAKFDKELLGSILLFEEQPELRPTDVMENDTPIHLEYYGKVLKRLTLHWQKVPEEIIVMDEKEYAYLDFAYNYESVLEQIRTGSLKIDDIIQKPIEEEPPPSPLKDIPVVPPEKSEEDSSSPSSSCDSSDNEIIEEPKKELDKDSPIRVLKDLVRKPIRDPQYYDYLDGNSFATDKEFYILKEIYMKSINYERILPKIQKESWSQLVNINASMDEGIIQKKEWDEINDDDIRQMLTFSNFHNLSIEMKIIILTDYLKQEKQLLKRMSTLEALQQDEYGRTPKKRYKLIKSFLKDLKYNIYVENMRMTLY